MATGKGQCVKCDNETSTVRCEDCQQFFCDKHLTNHRQELKTELDQIETSCNNFQQTLTEQMNNPNNDVLIKQIDQWEQESIRRIRQTAQQCRDMLFQHTNTHLHQIEANLTKLTYQLRRTREEEDFNETDLQRLKENLKQLSEGFQRQSDVSIQYDSVPFIDRISVVVSLNFPLTIKKNQKWKQYATTIAGGHREGGRLDQFYAPFGISIDDNNQCIYIADDGNNRIIEQKFCANNIKVVAGRNEDRERYGDDEDEDKDDDMGENGDGDRDGDEGGLNELEQPTDVIVDKKNDSLIICDRDNRRVVEWSRQSGTKKGKLIISNIDCWGIAMDNNGDLYVSDYKKHEVRKWKRGETQGIIVAGGNGQGDQLNQLDHPTYLFVDKDQSVYVSEYNNNRVTKWIKGAEAGVIVAGGQGYGHSLSQLASPYGILVDQWENVYVADHYNNRIMCWSKGSREGRVIVGGKGEGESSNQLHGPTGILFDRQGHLYVVEERNSRVQKFEIDYQ